MYVYKYMYVYICVCVHGPVLRLSTPPWVGGWGEGGGPLPATGGEGVRSHMGAVYGSMQRQRHRYEYTRALPATGGKGGDLIWGQENVYIYICI